jgi:peptidoglycan/LPS O-acetylase OafA/YrhL
MSGEIATTASSLPYFQASHLPSLDDIRAVAVLAVVEFHYYESALSCCRRGPRAVVPGICQQLLHRH